MVISGEAFPFVEALEFDSKEQLVEKLEQVKMGAVNLPEPDRTIVEEMVDATMDEIAYCAEAALMELKHYIDKYKPTPKPK